MEQLNKDLTHHQEVGQRIRRLREHRGLSQEQLAAKLGLVQGTISSIENDRFDIGLGYIFLFKKHLNVDPNWLITGVNYTLIRRMVEGHTDIDTQEMCFYFGLTYKEQYEDFFKIIQVPEVLELLGHKVKEIDLMIKGGYIPKPGELAPKAH